MKVLFISFYGEPEDVSSSYYEKDLKTHLLYNGFDVETICPNPVRGLSKQDISFYSKIHYEDKEYGRLIRVFVNKDKSNSKLSRIVRMFIFIKKIKRYITEHKKEIDCVFFYSNPPIFLPLFVSKLCKKLNIQCVYQINDIWPNITNKYMFLNKVSLKPIKLADKIITLSQDMKQYIGKFVSEDKISVIRIWPYEKNGNELIDEPLLKRIKNDKRYKVCYIGNIGEFQNMELILDIASHLRHNNDIVFYFIGNGRLSSFVQNEIKRRKLLNALYIQKTNNFTAQALYNESDLNIISLKKGNINFCCPSKTSTCINSKTNCLLLVDNSNYSNYLVSNHGFLLNDSFDASIIAQQISDIFSSGKNYRIFVDNDKMFDKNFNLDLWLQFFKKIRK